MLTRAMRLGRTARLIGNIMNITVVMVLHDNLHPICDPEDTKGEEEQSGEEGFQSDASSAKSPGLRQARLS
jgi:hypothetical protein